MKREGQGQRKGRGREQEDEDEKEGVVMMIEEYLLASIAMGLTSMTHLATLLGSERRQMIRN